SQIVQAIHLPSNADQACSPRLVGKQVHVATGVSETASQTVIRVWIGHSDSGAASPPRHWSLGALLRGSLWAALVALAVALLTHSLEMHLVAPEWAKAVRLYPASWAGTDVTHDAPEEHRSAFLDQVYGGMGWATIREPERPLLQTVVVTVLQTAASQEPKHETFTSISVPSSHFVNSEQSLAHTVTSTVTVLRSAVVNALPQADVAQGALPERLSQLSQDVSSERQADVITSTVTVTQSITGNALMIATTTRSVTSDESQAVSPVEEPSTMTHAGGLVNAPTPPATSVQTTISETAEASDSPRPTSVSRTTIFVTVDDLMRRSVTGCEDWRLGIYVNTGVGVLTGLDWAIQLFVYGCNRALPHGRLMSFRGRIRRA
ncbi:hypothetical protein DENSPDRAFT_855707, partial [Dentipellis sp. KUC8613]